MSGFGRVTIGFWISGRPKIRSQRQTSQQPRISNEEERLELEKTFKLGVEFVDLGTILRGTVRSVPIPIHYSGTLPVRLEAKAPNRLAWLDESTTHAITSRVSEFRILFDATEFDGAFEFSFPISVRLNELSIDRTFIIRGNVFAPITFRQAPAVLSSTALGPFEVIVRNNTPEPATIESIISDGKLDVLAAPDSVGAQSEAVIRFVRLSLTESVPERIWISFSKPVEGKELYDFRLRWGPP